jgi:16S rRNA (adenine1518-N6/adenine1519-N6)-dimethyltransferase
VHSTVLRLNVAPQIEKLGIAGDGFIGFLKLSFAQKRKTLWNNLKSRYAEAELRRAMTQARINPSARAETLSLKQSATLFRALRGSPEGS